MIDSIGTLAAATAAPTVLWQCEERGACCFPTCVIATRAGGRASPVHLGAACTLTVAHCTVSDGTAARADMWCTQRHVWFLDEW